HPYARLAATAQRLTGRTLAVYATYDAPAYDTPGQLLADLDVVSDSLSSHHAGMVGRLRLDALRQAVAVFGFHMATVDLRQSSDVHERVLAELFRAADVQWQGKTVDYTALTEEERVQLLRTEIHQRRPLVSPWFAYSPETEKELAVLRMAAECRRRFGPTAVEQVIVSHTETLSDLLEVLLLQQETGLSTPAPRQANTAV